MAIIHPLVHLDQAAQRCALGRSQCSKGFQQVDVPPEPRSEAQSSDDWRHCMTHVAVTIHNTFLSEPAWQDSADKVQENFQTQT
jgi:hypothetical protein